MQNYVKYVVKTCLKNEHRVNLINETWGANQNIYWLNDLTEEDVSLGHDGLTKKLRRFFKYSQPHENEFILLCDDDTYVNTKAVQEYVDKLSPTHRKYIGRGIMATRQSARYQKNPCEDGKYNTRDVWNYALQPKLKCSPHGCGVLISPMMFALIQLSIWNNLDDPDIIADDQWLSNIVLRLKQNAQHHGAHITYNEVSEPTLFLSTKCLKEDDHVENIKQGKVLCISAASEENMKKIHEWTP